MNRAPQRQFVLVCRCHPKANGLGRVQRLVLAYLGTAPAGFSMTVSSPAGELLEHGPPMGITVRSIAEKVYATAEPTAAQTRVVQRNVRRLEQLGLVECWHAVGGYMDRAYTTRKGVSAVMPQAISVLRVALKWSCPHEDSTTDHRDHG